MNILFVSNFCCNPLVGGIENVTYVLGNYFIRQGHSVSFVSQEPAPNHPSIQDELPRFYFPAPLTAKGFEPNLKYLTTLVTELGITHLINQNAEMDYLHELAKQCRSANGYRLVSCFHSDIFHYEYKRRTCTEIPEGTKKAAAERCGQGTRVGQNRSAGALF